MKVIKFIGILAAASFLFSFNAYAQEDANRDADGKVVKGFDGKVVFAPATDGKKVQLTFKEIDVFYTDYAANSTGYVDYIKVYNGNSTDEKDLLWQLTQAEASSKSDIVIKSTAADGKLTITQR